MPRQVLAALSQLRFKKEVDREQGLLVWNRWSEPETAEPKLVSETKPRRAKPVKSPLPHGETFGGFVKLHPEWELAECSREWNLIHPDHKVRGRPFIPGRN